MLMDLANALCRFDFAPRDLMPVMSCPSEGAVMRRHACGTGCGAWVAVVYANSGPGRLGPPPAPIARWGLPLMAGRGRTEGRRQMPPGSGRGYARPSGSRKSGPEPRDAAMERRRARVPIVRHAAPDKRQSRM